MIALRGMYINRWILLVVALQIQLLLLVQLAGVDGGSDARRAIAEHRQGIDIDIVIDKDDGMLRLFDEADDLCVGIEYLSIVEDAFHWDFLTKPQNKTPDNPSRSSGIYDNFAIHKWGKGS